jgi:hypothetical protein
MTVDDYAAWAAGVARVSADDQPDRERLSYLGLGLAGETGEAVEHIKKLLREGVWRADDFADELGDVAYSGPRYASRPAIRRAKCWRRARRRSRGGSPGESRWVDPWYLRAQITRWIDDDQPGLIECRFMDRFGRERSIIEKLPIVTEAALRADSQFPQPAFIGCPIISRGRDDSGLETVEITAEAPQAIEATDGAAIFQLFTHQLTETAR